ncbi:MAG TPA: DUF4097 family beta strand repeat-containing protein [Kofleriaceae bacterium]|jgi:hypothetical protein
MTFRILPVLALTTGCITGGPRLTTTLPAVEIAGHTRVRVASDDGSVRVTPADISQVQLSVDSAGYEIPKDLEISMTPHGDQVDIVVKTHDHFRLFDLGSRSLHIDVRIPRDAEIQVNSGDGSVEVEEVAGNVDVRTGDGRIAVAGARGNIRLHTGDGSINAHGLDGCVDASTHDGSVKLEGRFDSLAVRTGDGRLVATALPGSRVMQPWHLETGDGSVALGLPRDLGAHIDASTRDGRVRSTIPLAGVRSSRAEGDINGGGPPIVVRTGDGSIELTQF